MMIFSVNMINKSIIICLVFQTLFLVGCFSHKIKSTSNIDREKIWNDAFDTFIENSPKCPNGKHTLIEGQKSFANFSGSCFECRKPLNATVTEVNRFTSNINATVSKVYTCTEECKYNVCESCASK